MRCHRIGLRGRLHPPRSREGCLPLFRRQERRRLDAGVRRGAPEDGERARHQNPVRRERAGGRRPDQAGRREIHPARRTTSSSAPPSAIPTRSRSWRTNIPKVAFLNASGTTNGPNLQSFYGRTYESQYLCGMVAGAVSKTGKLGFVAAHPIGPVNWTINAYELGAKKINPNATVTVIFTGAWNDPVKERAAAAGAGRPGHRRDRPARRYADAADRRAGARHLRHRPSPRSARVRAQGDAVLVGLDLGQVPDRPSSRRSWPATGSRSPMAPSPASRRRHRHRLLRPRRAEGGRRQGHGRARRDHRRQADLSPDR